MTEMLLIPKLVIAGPGSGKTTDMVDEILSVLPNLHHNRVLSTITYTNSAADTIRERLSQKINIPRNIFIGTIHKFLNQFIVIPYATLLGHAGLNKLFLEIDVDKIAEQKIKLPKSSPLYFRIKNTIRARVLKSLLEDGKIPLDQISIIASNLMANKNISYSICNRLQYLFIDEFQDVDLAQLDIFDKIRLGNRTYIYAVGDPEQYVMGFTYVGKSRPSFDKLPINRFKCEKVYKTENHRSYEEIVNFTNHFHTAIKQKSTKGKNPNSEVIFIQNSILREIVIIYQNKCKEIKYDQPPLHFYLSYENKTFEPVIDLGVAPLSIDKPFFKTTLEASLELITNVVSLTKKQLSEKYHLEPLEVRKLGVALLKAISEKKVLNVESLFTFISKELNLEPNVIDGAMPEKLLHGLELIMQTGMNVFNNHQFSSIHRAKGLEADTVLVVAKTNNELGKWLTTEVEARQSDSNDSCRLGFVAFSRAKVLLCIGCLESLSEENRKTLVTLSVAIYSQPQQPQQAQLF
jgi:DNA helicase-2/ATP-dependent DNA helicase PcrA